MEKNLSKKYKFVKIYPGSGLIGRIKQISNHNLSNGHIELNGKLILPSEYKEFWEEIVEKDYEILETRISNNLQQVIRKVKRLNDGEVFTVGDFVKETITGRCEGWEIKEFSLKDIRCFSCGVNINNIEKLKKPLFTTKDGVDIIPKSNGEFQYWSLKLDNWKISDAPHILNSNKIIPTKTENLIKCCNVLRFSTREKAEEYILMNKPCLSINEVKKHLVYRIEVSKLKELAKKKL